MLTRAATRRQWLAQSLPPCSESVPKLSQGSPFGRFQGGILPCGGGAETESGKKGSPSRQSKARTRSGVRDSRGLPLAALLGLRCLGGPLLSWRLLGARARGLHRFSSALEASEANLRDFLRERVTTKPHSAFLLTGPAVGPSS